jgi:hypothetical protein
MVSPPARGEARLPLVLAERRARLRASIEIVVRERAG